jgi:prepilin peptidase CpaA
MSLSLTQILPIALASAVMGVGVVDDLRSRKFHNWLFLTCTAVGLVFVIAMYGIAALPLSFLGFVVGIAALMPFVLLKIVGAGDMKLMAAFGLIAGYSAVVPVIVYGLIWGALFGVVRTIANGGGRVLALNLVSIVTFKERKRLELHRMPFTVGLLMGWLTYLTVGGLLS